MVETKTTKQKIEELEKKMEIEKLEKRLENLKASEKKDPEQAKAEPEPTVKERLPFEVLRVLKTNYNWKFLAGAIFTWFILWLFNH
jgi:hypothetical protein